MKGRPAGTTDAGAVAESVSGKAKSAPQMVRAANRSAGRKSVGMTAAGAVAESAPNPRPARRKAPAKCQPVCQIATEAHAVMTGVAAFVSAQREQSAKAEFVSQKPNATEPAHLANVG